MHVVVMVDEPLDDPTGPGEPCVWPDEDVDGASADETMHQVLGEPPVDLVNPPRRELRAVDPRIVDVHVEPALMRGVAGLPESRSEVPSAWPAEVPHPDPGRVGMRRRELPQYR